MIITSRNTLRRLVVALATMRRSDRGTAWSVGIVSLSILGWIAYLIVMGDMEPKQGTLFLDFPTFLSSWVIMLTAMMLPSEILYIKVYATLLESSIENQQKKVSGFTCVIYFIAGYGIAWMIYGIVAFFLDTVFRESIFYFIPWHQAKSMLASSVLFLAGIYQVSSLKHACLTHCRSPLSYFARNWQHGTSGSLRMGLFHGFVCVGCCWALMGVMFAVGSMSLIWMGFLTFLMFAEKILPCGHKLTIPIAAFLWVMGIWIAVSPESAPLLKDSLLFYHHIN